MRELLDAVPSIQRPLWVAEQLEVALFEGLGHRISAATRWFASGRRARGRYVRGHWVSLPDGRRVFIESHWRCGPTG
ncbi:MAG: hypothetical protein ACRDQ4_00355 [Pseudonocardiaceae bacterium]